MAQNHSDRRNACSNCSEYLAEVLARCGYIEMNFLPSQTSDRDMIRPAAIRVYMAILRYTVQVLTTQNFSPGKAIFDDITAAACQRLVEYRSSIEKEEQKLSQYITWDQYLRSEKNSQRILREIDESVAKSLKDLIAKFSLPIASEAFHNSFKDQYESLCLEGTRVQLLDQITQWARLPQGECIFWLNGMAGTGKSTIARTVAESSKEGGQLGASFFFKKGEPGRGNASLFISTIVKQLMAHSQQLTLAVLQAIDKDPDIALKALREQFEKLLLEPLQSVQSRSTTTMVIVIDALDECDSAEQIRTILEYLPRVQSPIGIRLKIFLTSRPDNPIVSWFQEHDTHQSMILHQISDTVVEDDISRFLQDRFAKIRKSKNISADWPGTGTIQELVKLSTPLFISAATVCLFIENERLNPVKRLEELLENQNKYVERMDKTYMPIMEQLLDGQHLDDRAQLLKQFRQTVGVIILLAAPLSVNALSVLIDSPEQTVESDLDCFRSVLNVPTERFSPVRILHLSFREFLLNTPSKFRVEEGKTHSEIAEHCLRTMNRKHNLKHDICNLRNYGILRADISPERIRQCLKPELQYSCRYWVYHLEQSKPLTVERERELLSFLQEHFLHWVEAMSLMGIVSETVKMIDKLGKLLLERQVSVCESDI
ncbi:hypothetical protein N7488_008810 [Penicillium malachiteum]|nr:hypothetical protein N7488_008810 [Penicillium malachiteum]